MTAYENYMNVLKKIKKTTHRNIVLVPVSKYAKSSDMENLYNNNVKIFGESRVEKFIKKKDLFPQSKWHMIGSIQTRKVKDVVGNFDLIHSLDREKLALEIEKRSLDKSVISNCLVQVNISKEESKSGLEINEVEDFLLYLADFKNLQVKGLMTMAPYVENPEEVRYVFRELDKLKNKLKLKGFDYVNELSMGMSNDYLVAIEEGATIVRVGSEIFN